MFSIKTHSLYVLLLLAITLAMFGNVLFSSQNVVLSRPGGDIDKEFIHSRAFGFEQLRQGNLALWNPHIYSGTPYLGGFQSALLYPPNILFLFLPVAIAINASIALHTFLLGLFMYLWTTRRGLHPLACLVSSVLLMFCGSHFLHIYSGHLSNLCTMAWVPLLFLSVDELLRKKSLGFFLVGVSAVAMQILAGHPQYVFYTAIAVGLYVALEMFHTHRWWTMPIVLAAMYLFASCLTAIQLLPGIETAHEVLRSSQTSDFFAAMFSFPPENLITLIAPRFYGDYLNFPYWGRSYLWEMSLFVGVTGLLLGLHGLLYADRRIRGNCLAMILILVALALGTHTFIHKPLCEIFPFFGWFRGNSKFLFPASLFLVLLSGIGMDQLLRSNTLERKTGIFALALGTILASASVMVYSPIWPFLMRTIGSTHQYYFSPKAYGDPAFIGPAADFSAHNFLSGAFVCFLFGIFLLLRKNYPNAVYAIALMAILEIFVFSKSYEVSTDLRSPTYAAVNVEDAKLAKDDRIMLVPSPNRGMSLGWENIWGFDPSMQRRYAEFLCFTQGLQLDHASQNLEPTQKHPLFAMLRCRAILIPSADGMKVENLDKVLPRMLLVQNYEMLPGRDKLFERMAQTDFDPSHTVLLEQEPNPQPVPSDEKGTVKLLDSSTDYLTIEVDTPQPAILLITDAYSKGWRVTPSHYKVFPANYILRAIPLDAGQHRLRLEYMPTGFLTGKWISLVSILLFVGLVVFRNRIRSIQTMRFR